MSEAANPELAAIDAYLDVAPRAVCRAEPVGPFTLFVGTGPWRYYGRPTPGHGRELTVTDVLAVLERQRELSQPETLEWIHEVVPELGRIARRAGLDVTFRPLMRRTGMPSEVNVPGVRVRALLAAPRRRCAGDGETGRRGAGAARPHGHPQRQRRRRGAPVRARRVLASRERRRGVAVEVRQPGQS